MSKTKATPFGALLGIAPPVRQPKGASVTVVVGGQKVDDARCINNEQAGGDNDLRRALQKAASQARRRARDQREREDPEAMARRAARQEREREARREYMRKYREQHREAIRATNTAWSRRKYHQDPEAAAQRARDWYAANKDKARAQARDRYQRNREHYLALAAEKRARKRAELAAAEAASKPVNAFSCVAPAGDETTTEEPCNEQA